ncbi:B-type flagellin [mine drainage metagenome]|uniref:B-type flagellin n=1 Tax=mine drainage metagenome TaxID=410659 RepID=A0A1J5QJ83_9ZZZZ
MAISGIINTNVNALTTLNALGSTSSNLSTYIQQLSTGKQINGPADNPAGYSIAQRFQTQINGLNQAVSNGNQGVSLVQTATSALQSQTTLLQQIRTIAVQSANASNTSADRSALQSVVSQLLAQVQTVATQTQFNGQNLLDGSFAGAAFQVGANSNQIINVSVANAQTNALGNYVTTTSGTSSAGVYTASGAFVLDGNYAGGGFTVTSGSAQGATGGAGNFTSGTVAISGSAGSADVTVLSSDSSAAQIASSVNQVSSQTGVTATAYTSVAFDVQASGSISFTLGNGTSGSVTNAVNISATITGDGKTTPYDLSSLVSAINNQAASTGISANTQTVNGTQELVLTQSQGQNITIQASISGGGSGLSSGSTAQLQTVYNSVDSNGTVTTGSIGGNLSSGSSGVLVQGVVQFESSSSYALGSGSNIGFSSQAATLTSGVGGSSVASINVSTAAGAQAAITILDQAINTLNTQGGALGSIQQRIQASVSNAQTAATNLQSAQSVVQDANIAAATTNLSKYQILQQAGISTLAQANSLQQSYLKLLP